MFIFRKHLSRRTLLRGAGSMVALPFLDAMAPAQTPTRRTAAMPRTLLACLYVPHGATMDKWTPSTTGTGFTFTQVNWDERESGDVFSNPNPSFVNDKATGLFHFRGRLGILTGSTVALSAAGEPTRFFRRCYGHFCIYLARRQDGCPSGYRPQGAH